MSNETEATCSSLAEELDQVKRDIRSTLIPFQKSGCNLRIFEETYLEHVGKSVPYQRFGYNDLERFLMEMPDVVDIHYIELYPNRGCLLKAVVVPSTQHIQKSTARPGRRRAGGGRRESSRVPTSIEKNSQSSSKLQPAGIAHLPARPRIRPVPEHEQRSIKELVNNYPEGLRIVDFERAYKHTFGSGFTPTTYGFLDLKECLSSLTAILKLVPNKDPERIFAVDTSDLRSTSCDASALEGSSSGEITEFSTSKMNFKQVLAEFPDGLLLNELPREFERIIKQPFKCNDYGCYNALELAGRWTDVFRMQRPSGTRKDWLLFDSSKPPPVHVSEADEVQCSPRNNRPNSPATISSKVKANVETLLLAHPDGIRLDEFQSVYEKNCGEVLPWVDLGYDSIVNFFLALDLVQLYSCKSGNVIVVHESKVSNQTRLDTIHDRATDPVLPGMDYKYLLVTVEMSSEKCVEVYVSWVNDPGEIWIQLESMDWPTTAILEELTSSLRNAYNCDAARVYVIPDRYLKVNMVCSVIYPGDKSWRRGKITGFISGNIVEVLFVDYGIVRQVEKQDLRFLRNEFLDLAAQAVKVRLANVQPVGERWSSGTKAKLKAMCMCKPFLAKVTSTTYKDTVSVLLTDTTGEDDIHVNKVLLDEDLVQYCKDDDDVEIFTPSSFLEPQVSIPFNYSPMPIGYDDLLYEVERQTACLYQITSNLMNAALPYSGVNPKLPILETPEDQGIDPSVLQNVGAVQSLPVTQTPVDCGIDLNVFQKLVAMGEVKPLNVDVQSSARAQTYSGSNHLPVAQSHENQGIDSSVTLKVGAMKPVQSSAPVQFHSEPSRVPITALPGDTGIDPVMQKMVAMGAVKTLNVDVQSPTVVQPFSVQNCLPVDQTPENQGIVSGVFQKMGAVKPFGFDVQSSTPVHPFSVQNELPVDTTHEDWGIDSSVFQKMVAMGAVKPLDVGVQRSAESVKGLCSSSNSVVASVRPVEPELHGAKRDGRKNESYAFDAVACEILEQKRYSQVISLNGNDLHLINFCGKPYLTSGDIATIIWGMEHDMCKKMLSRWNIEVPNIVVHKKECEDLFKDLEERSVTVSSDGDSVNLFPIGSVRVIIAAFHTENKDVVLQKLEQVEKYFNPCKPYWTSELKGDAVTRENDQKSKEVERKGFELLERMVQSPTGTGSASDMLELQEINTCNQMKQVKGCKEPCDTQTEPLTYPDPELKRGSPNRRIQSVRPNASLPVTMPPQANIPLMPYSLIPVIPSMAYPPDFMYYALRYPVTTMPKMELVPQQVPVYFVPQNAPKDPSANYHHA